jgi:hypothetical protein
MRDVAKARWRQLPAVPLLLWLLCALSLAPGLAVSRATTASDALQQQGPLHHLRPDRHGTDSTNWSGYAATGAPYTAVYGSWMQPAVTCVPGQTAYAAFWVGLDGDTTSTVEQIGTDADCSKGMPVAYAWFEMYPRYPVSLAYRVAPGDHLNAVVRYQGSGRFLLTLSDTTRGWSFQTVQTEPRALRGSAEWIAEAPAGSSGTLPLANFGTVAFSDCGADNLAIDSNAGVQEVSLVGSNGSVEARPAPLVAGGTAFSVTWLRS